MRTRLAIYAETGNKNNIGEIVKTAAAEVAEIRAEEISNKLSTQDYETGKYNLIDTTTFKTRFSVSKMNYLRQNQAITLVEKNYERRIFKVIGLDFIRKEYKYILIRCEAIQDTNAFGS